MHACTCASAEVRRACACASPSVLAQRVGRVCVGVGEHIGRRAEGVRGRAWASVSPVGMRGRGGQACSTWMPCVVDVVGRGAGRARRRWCAWSTSLDMALDIVGHQGGSWTWRWGCWTWQPGAGRKKPESAGGVPNNPGHAMT